MQQGKFLEKEMEDSRWLSLKLQLQKENMVTNEGDRGGGLLECDVMCGV